MALDGDLKLTAQQWHQLCGDVGLASPIGEPTSPHLVTIPLSSPSGRPGTRAAEATVQASKSTQQLQQPLGNNSYGW
jgi:hypothetical protein